MALDIYISLKNSYRALLHSLRIASSNAQQFNTPGFKTTHVRFSTLFSRMVHSGTEKTNPQVLETGVTVGTTVTDFKQGNLGLGTELDVAIVGEGFFITSSSATDFSASSSKTYTRAGRFSFDFNNKYMVDSFGRKVFGYKVNQNGDRIGGLVPVESDGELDLGFDDGGILVTNFKAHKTSVAEGNAEHPEKKKLFRLALQTFPNKNGLVQSQGTAYRATLAAGVAIPDSVSGDGIYGTIVSSTLEGSNVDVAQVALDMTLINRGLSAVNGIIDDVNKMLSNVIAKLAG